MLKRFIIVAILSFFVALAVATAASYFIQTNETNRLTDIRLNTLLDDVNVLMDENETEVKNIRADLDNTYLEKTRAFAEMIKLNPSILDDYDELCRIRDFLGVDELHVCDENGVLQWGTVTDFYGFNFQDGDQTRPILAALDNPNFELAQDPQISGTGFYFQYISISRYDKKGIVQIGMRPERLEQALQAAAPENILKQIKIDQTIRILITSGDTVLGDSKSKLTGATLSGNGSAGISEGGGSISIDGTEHYIARKIGGYLVVAVISNADMYGTRNTTLIVFLIANAIILFLLILVIGMWIIRTVINPLGQVSHELEVIADGNLELRVNVNKTHEFETLSSGINTMVNNIKNMLDESGNTAKVLQSVMGSVEGSVESVDQTTRELFQESHNLAEEAQSQSQAAERMSSLLGDVHTNAIDNAKHASDASGVSRIALQNAGTGSEKMVDMVKAVEAINTASQDIAKVMKTIDDIAFQTNILALNAAVEAARAGTHGKGFAVVAEEVRNLAGKSAEAAKQTEVLISASIQRAQTGVAIANETSGTITEIVENIRKSASLMEGIVASSQEQVSAVGQLNDSMTTIQKSIEVTGLSASRITAESEKLQSNSREMNTVINKISAPHERLKLSDC